MAETIKVAILDDHLPIIDGFKYRLKENRDIEVVATASYGDDLFPMLERFQTDVLILDIDVPVSEYNQERYPIPTTIPKLISKFTQLQILIISMHYQKALIKLVLENGASGYILKDDYKSISNLASIIKNIYNGEIYLTESVLLSLQKKYAKKNSAGLSVRQHEILSICMNNPEIKTIEVAEKLNLAHSTVRNALSQVYMKLGVRNRHAAILQAQSLGLIQKDKNII